MKTAVSLPDDLYELAEAAAKRLRVSRSELYAQALAFFLQQNADDVTARLNKLYGDQPAQIDPAFFSAQIRSIDTDSW